MPPGVLSPSDVRTWYTASCTLEAGEEGIWTDIEGSAEAMSAYEDDVNKLKPGCGY